MARPVDNIKIGQIEIAKWAGEYEGKPTTSFSLKKKKFNKDTKEFEETPFLGVMDLQNIILAAQCMLQKHYSPVETPEDTPFS